MHISSENEYGIQRVIDECGKILDRTQNKIDLLYEKKGYEKIQWDSIGVSAGDSVSDSVNSDMLISLNRIIQVDPNAKWLDIYNKIKNENIVILSGSLRSEVSKWYKNGNYLFPDCCDIAFECGYKIDYLIVNKKEACFLCSTPFRLEYFI